MCTCVSVYLYTCVPVHLYLCTCAPVYLYTCTCVSVYLCTCIPPPVPVLQSVSKAMDTIQDLMEFDSTNTGHPHVGAQIKKFMIAGESKVRQRVVKIHTLHSL